MIAANSVSYGVSGVPPPWGRTFDGGISGLAISHSPSGTIQLHVPRAMSRSTSRHHIGHGLTRRHPSTAWHRCRRRAARSRLNPAPGRHAGHPTELSFATVHAGVVSRVAVTTPLFHASVLVDPCQHQIKPISPRGDNAVERGAGGWFFAVA